MKLYRFLYIYIEIEEIYKIERMQECELKMILSSDQYSLHHLILFKHFQTMK